MAKQKELSLQDLNEGYNSLSLEDKIAHFIHVKTDLDEERKRAGDELAKLSKLDSGK